MDLVTKAPKQEEISQNSPSLQSFPGTGQQSFVFGDWGGLRSWLSDRGIDLGLSYLSEPAWNVAGGMAPGGTYAGQENLRLDLNWEKIASINGFSTHIDFVSRLGSSNVSSKYVGDVLFQAQEIYGSPSVVQAVTHLAYFYGEQQLFNGFQGNGELALLGAAYLTRETVEVAASQHHARVSAACTRTNTGIDFAAGVPLFTS
jgi:hypothetical protein